MKFEWDEKKNHSNIEKHGLSFTQAVQIFRDPNTLYLPDPEHSDSEERWIGLGSLNNLKIVVLVFVDRSNPDEEIIRVISARKANQKEKQQYIDQLE